MNQIYPETNVLKKRNQVFDSILANVYCSPLNLWPGWTLHSQMCPVCISSFEYPHHLHTPCPASSALSTMFELSWFCVWMPMHANILATPLRSSLTTVHLIDVLCSQETRLIRQNLTLLSRGEFYVYVTKTVVFWTLLVDPLIKGWSTHQNCVWGL